MKVRRGLLFAGIHLAIAAGMFAWNEVPYWQFLKSENAPSHSPLRQIAWQEEGEVDFNPCDWTDRQSSPMETIMMAQIGFLGFAGAGHVPCSSESGIERFIEARFGTRTKQSEAVIGVVTCLAIAFQWLLVGGFPLVRPRRWWLEPGAFITLCTCVAANLLCLDGLFLLARRGAVPDARLFFGVGVYRLVLCPALIMWLVWAGLFVWRGASGMWRSVRVQGQAS
ncbi:MAG TPA: hypothetical protein VGJ21_26315 [Terracidiphilus sp.]|jgi:hypothetical protein